MHEDVSMSTLHSKRFLCVNCNAYIYLLHAILVSLLMPYIFVLHYSVHQSLASMYALETFFTSATVALSKLFYNVVFTISDIVFPFGSFVYKRFLLVLSHIFVVSLKTL